MRCTPESPYGQEPLKLIAVYARAEKVQGNDNYERAEIAMTI